MKKYRIKLTNGEFVIVENVDHYKLTHGETILTMFDNHSCPLCIVKWKDVLIVQRVYYLGDKTK